MIYKKYSRYCIQVTNENGEKTLSGLPVPRLYNSKEAAEKSLKNRGGFRKREDCSTKVVPVTLTVEVIE